MNKRVCCLAFLLLCWSINVLEAAQKGPDISTVFIQLNDFSTTDRAVSQILALASSDPASRDYVIQRLPAMIEKSTSTSDRVWQNAVRLVRWLKAVDLAPLLLKVFPRPPVVTGLFVFQESMTLSTDPVGQALCEIGDSVVPALADVLAHGDQKLRLRAARVLWNIDSASSRKVMHDDLEHETDPALKGLKEGKSSWQSSQSQ